MIAPRLICCKDSGDRSDDKHHTPPLRARFWSPDVGYYATPIETHQEFGSRLQRLDEGFSPYLTAGTTVTDV